MENAHNYIIPIPMQHTIKRVSNATDYEYSIHFWNVKHSKIINDIIVGKGNVLIVK